MSQIHPIEVDLNSLIVTLKKKIKEEKRNDLVKIDSNNIRLWKLTFLMKWKMKLLTFVNTKVRKNY